MEYVMETYRRSIQLYSVEWRSNAKAKRRANFTTNVNPYHRNPHYGDKSYQIDCDAYILSPLFGIVLQSYSIALIECYR